MRQARPFANPYLAGAALGLVLLACLVLTGQGLGASGAFANGASALAAAAAPQLTSANSYFLGYLQAGSAWSAWIVVQVCGLVAGGFVSALFNGRFRLAVDRQAHAGRGLRLAAAGSGGTLLGAGAVLAGGCTSGLALSGGAMLGVGSWVFMIAVFAAGYAAIPFFRRLWQ